MLTLKRKKLFSPIFLPNPFKPNPNQNKWLLILLCAILLLTLLQKF